MNSLQTLNDRATALNFPMAETDLDQVLQGYTTTVVGVRPWDYFDAGAKAKLLEAMKAGDPEIEGVAKKWAFMGNRIEELFGKK